MVDSIEPPPFALNASAFVELALVAVLGTSEWEVLIEVSRGVLVDSFVRLGLLGRGGELWESDLLRRFACNQ